MISDEKVLELLELMGKFFRQGIRRHETEGAFGEGALLMMLRDRGEIIAGDICKNLSVGSGRASNLLKRTEEKGYIIRVKDVSDGRKVIVRITPEGRAETERRQKKMFGELKKTLEFLGEEDTGHIIRILGKITENNIEKSQES